jgi:hypothetical protein
MARYKTTTCKQVMTIQSRWYPEIDWMLERPSESHDDERNGWLLPERSLLHTLDDHAEPLYIDKKTPLCSKGHEWEVHMVLYEKPRGTGERRVCRVHHASAPRATFEAGIHDATHQALMVLHH